MRFAFSEVSVFIVEQCERKGKTDAFCPFSMEYGATSTSTKRNADVYFYNNIQYHVTGQIVMVRIHSKGQSLERSRVVTKGNSKV